jgi:hypothetical protein
VKFLAIICVPTREGAQVEEAMKRTMLATCAALTICLGADEVFAQSKFQCKPGRPTS